jgi:malate dehydrogenase (oxaloacetate-decarboxylating)(NADP+)
VTIVVAGMINAGRIKVTRQRDEKYVFLAADSAGIGPADLLCAVMVEEGLTLTETQ